MAKTLRMSMQMDVDNEICTEKMHRNKFWANFLNPVCFVGMRHYNLTFIIQALSTILENTDIDSMLCTYGLTSYHIFSFFLFYCSLHQFSCCILF